MCDKVKGIRYKVQGTGYRVQGGRQKENWEVGRRKAEVFDRWKVEGIESNVQFAEVAQRLRAKRIAPGLSDED